MDKPVTVLQYEAVEVSSPDALSASAIGAIRLGSRFWLSAALLQAGAIGFQFITTSVNDAGWETLRSALQQPNIVGAAIMARYWFAVPIEVVLWLLSALLWTSASWLLSDMNNERLTNTGRWVRLAAITALGAGGLFNLFPVEWQFTGWWLVVVNLDVLLALAVAMHLRQILHFVPMPALEWIVQKLPWLIAADLVLTLLAWVSVPEVAARMNFAVEGIVAICGLLLIAAMLLLARATDSPASATRGT